MNDTPGMTVATPTDTELVVARTLDAPRALVFEAWTEPRHLSRWLLGPEGWTMPVCEIDLRPGGAWHFVWESSDGNQMEMRGAYQEIVPPERVVSTESWGGDWPQTTNTLVLSDKDGKTMITHKMVYPTKEARDAALKTGMTRGMAQSFDRLSEYLVGLQQRCLTSK